MRMAADFFSPLQATTIVQRMAGSVHNYNDGIIVALDTNIIYTFLIIQGFSHVSLILLSNGMRNKSLEHQSATKQTIHANNL